MSWVFVAEALRCAHSHSLARELLGILIAEVNGEIADDVPKASP
jgi:hypothetical protein